MAGNDANTQLLIHCDGADNGTTFSDASQNAFAVTSAGSGVTHTTSFAAPKFGTASFKSATNGGLTVADNAALRPGSGDFTIDFWVYYNGGSIAETFYDKGNTSASGLLVTTAVGDNPPKLKLYNNSSSFLTETTGSALSTWTHKAIVRSSGVITIYSGGAANGSVANAVNFSATDNLGLGSRYISTTEPINGNMDEIRFSNIARWTTGFTPPTSAYSADLTSSITEAATATDVKTGVVAFLAAVAETATAADSENAGIPYTAAVAEAVAAADTAAAIVAFISAISEASTAADADSALLKFYASITESGAASDRAFAVLKSVTQRIRRSPYILRKLRQTPPILTE